MIQVAFYSGPGIVHRLIQWFTRRKHSHCEVVINGTGYTPRRGHNGLVRRSSDEYQTHWDLVSVDWSDKRVTEYLQAHQHMRYDLRSLIAHVVPIHDAIGRQNCAEFLVNMASYCGDPRFHNQPGWRYTPGDVYEALTKEG